MPYNSGLLISDLIYLENQLLLCCHHYLEYTYVILLVKSIFFYMHEGKEIGVRINFIEIFFLPRLKHRGGKRLYSS